MVAMEAENALQRAHGRCKLSRQRSEIQRAKIHLRKTLQNQSKCIYERQFAAMSSLQAQ